MADTPRPMNISDACTEIFRLEGMVRELRAERARGKEALPELPEPAYPQGSSCTRKEEAIADFYTADQMREYATAALSELRAEVERLKGQINWLEENATSIRETGAGLIEVRFIKANGFPGVQQSKSLSQCIDAARSAASGATPNTTEGA